MTFQAPTVQFSEPECLLYVSLINLVSHILNCQKTELNNAHALDGTFLKPRIE
jgi:hypothetical protein